eukprot:TRINITY_DN35628_c0_g1_i1.p1 TRINITY_DN35628_c0_g1~~TRINITY_DN35628_c0_g1_i1.p1  ORF type:complete len:143 (+),score=44.16 TRINITY_DN35628_c0_g1_i1:85-513(+)
MVGRFAAAAVDAAAHSSGDSVGAAAANPLTSFYEESKQLSKLREAARNWREFQEQQQHNCFKKKNATECQNAAQELQSASNIVGDLVMAASGGAKILGASVGPLGALSLLLLPGNAHGERSSCSTSAQATSMRRQATCASFL